MCFLVLSEDLLSPWRRSYSLQPVACSTLPRALPRQGEVWEDSEESRGLTCVLIAISWQSIFLQAPRTLDAGGQPSLGPLPSRTN